MKKIFLLFASALLSLGAMANVEFTFTRGADKAATVTAPEGLEATMATNVAWLTDGAMASRTEVLCPNRNTSQASGENFITYTLTVSGLAPGKEFAAAKFTNIAVNSGGNLQPSNNADIRHCNFTLSANDTEVASLTDQNIWIAAGQTDRTVTLVGTPFTADAEGNLTLVLKLAKGTNNGGCFYGLTKIELLDAVHTFSADKVYYIQWKNTGANYITENRNKSLTVADKKNSKYQFWKLIPADESHCYYIQNVVTGNYIKSCNNATKTVASTEDTDEPVAYYIGATAGGGEIAGCHYLSSTDCANYSNEAACPLALNKDGASSNVITWTAGLQDNGTDYKVGSYWKIVETNEEYQAPEPPVHGSYAKNLTVYFRPCGTTYNTYLTAATIGGVDPIAYTAAAKPGSFYVPFSKDRGAVVRGSEFSVSITLNSTEDADLKANAYFDWNADGEFEATEPITLDGTAGTATVTVPDDAVSGDTRMRIRLNSNGLDRADDDVEGFVYDFPFAVVDGERKVFVDVNGANNGTVTLSATAETYAVGTQLTATATPKGNATFESWREGGVVVSRDAEYTFTVEDRNMTLKAYFTPNTAIPAQWDFTFNRSSENAATVATVAVTHDGVDVEGVTATIAMSTNYKTDGKLASNDRTDLLCSTTNSANATADAPIKYTLTITNTTEETFAFDYIEVSDVALNASGQFQSASVTRVRNFKVTYGGTTIGPEERYICDPQHCNGEEYPQGFGAKVLVPAGGTYTIVLDIYNIDHDTGQDQIGSGCFYGLSKIALGAVPHYAVTVEGTEKAEAGVTYGNATYKAGSTLNATLSLTDNELAAAPVEGYQGSVALDKALGTILVTYQEVIAAQWDITFNRSSETATTEATATVTSKGAAVEGVTATIAIAGGYYQNADQTASNMGILCINRNTTLAADNDPNKYTLTITNNSDKIYSFDYAAVAGVALNSGGAYQGLDTNRDRYFKVSLGETALPAELLRICDNAHCNGKETFHAFAQPITLASGASYTIQVGIYTDGGEGCFYGLTRIAMGSTNVSIGSTGYTTLYTPIAMTVPAVEGVSFYKGVFDADDCALTLTAIAAGTNIPHETAVIIEGAPDSQFNYVTAARNSSAVSGNELKGTHSALAIATVNAGNNEAYTLQPYDNEEGVAFLRYSGEKLAAGKIYLMLPKSLATQQQAVRVRKFGTPTEMESAVRDAQGSQLIYDLQGRRVLNPTKGIYIVNGKKVIVK